MSPLRIPQKLVPAVAALGVLALSGCSEDAATPLTDEEVAAVKEQLAPVASVSVGSGSAAPASAPKADPAPPAAPAASAEAPAEPAPAEAPQAEPEATPAVAADAAPASTEAATPAEAAPAAAPDALELATSSGCMACHQLDVKLIGPAYKEVAAKYGSDPAALDSLVAKVKSGGTGVWGEIPMPPNLHVSDVDIKTIVTWVLAQ